MGNRTFCVILSLIALSSLSNRSCLGQEFPESLNYWELTFQIVRSPALRDALDISPSQKAAIDSLRSDKNLKELLLSKLALAAKDQSEKRQRLATELQENSTLPDEEKRARLRAQLSEQDLITKNRSFLSEGNDAVKAALGMILTAEQMVMLRPTVLRAKFLSGLQPFKDSEILSFCKVPETWPDNRVEAILQATTIDYKKNVTELKLESLKRVVAALPEDAQMKFVNYAGNLVAPEVRIVDDLASLSFERISSCDSPAITQLGLSKTLSSQLSGIEEQFFRSIRSVIPTGQTRSQWINEKERELDLSIRKLLTEQQVLAVLRAQAFDAVLNDIYKPFIRPEFVAYLKLDANTLRDIAILANQEQSNRLSAIRKLDGDVFEKLSATLPMPSKQRINELFHGVWEIPIERSVWISGQTFR